MKKSGIKGKIIIAVVAILCVSAVAYVVWNVVFSPYWNSVYAPPGYLSFVSMRAAEADDIIYTKEQAEEDLDYIVKCLERVHPLYKYGITDDFRECLNNEKNSFDAEVTSYELWQSAARLMSVTGDSNNIVAPSFSFHFLTDYLEKTDLGYKVLKINGLTVDEIFEENSDLFSYEREEWGKYALENCFQSFEGLKFIGFDCDNIEFTYLSSNGEEITVSYSEDDFYDYEKAAEILSKETGDMPDYSSEIDEKNNVGIITIDSCVYDTDFREFLYNFFEEVTESDIGNVVVDLRNNSGGTSQVAEEFVLYLNEDSFNTPGGTWRLGSYMMNWESDRQKIKHYDEMLFDGDVYVLTSSRTFSSATFFAELIQDNGFGKIVGEPCGNLPDCYSDAVVFQTPNSVLSFQVSSKHYERIDTSKSELPILPDIECDADDALEKVLSVIK